MYCNSRKALQVIRSHRFEVENRQGMNIFLRNYRDLLNEGLLMLRSRSNSSRVCNHQLTIDEPSKK